MLVVAGGAVAAGLALMKRRGTRQRQAPPDATEAQAGPAAAAAEAADAAAPAMPAPMPVGRAAAAAIPSLRSGALLVLRDARGQGLCVLPSGNGEVFDLIPTCAATGTLGLRVGHLTYAMAESVFVVEAAPGGMLVLRAIGAQGRPLFASPGRDAPHRVGPCYAAGSRDVGAAALWRQSSGGLSNPKTGKRLGFAVVELFAVSSEGLRSFEHEAAEQHSAALAHAARLTAQLTAAQEALQEQEQAAAMEWRSAQLEAARLKDQVRSADDARRDAQAQASRLSDQVLQLEQRIGQLSAEMQAAGQALATSEARAQGLAQRLAAMEAAYKAERRSWAASEGSLRTARAECEEELAAARASLAQLAETLGTRAAPDVGAGAPAVGGPLPNDVRVAGSIDAPPHPRVSPAKSANDQGSPMAQQKQADVDTAEAALAALDGCPAAAVKGAAAAALKKAGGDVRGARDSSAAAAGNRDRAQKRGNAAALLLPQHGKPTTRPHPAAEDLLPRQLWREEGAEGQLDGCILLRPRHCGSGGPGTGASSPGGSLSVRALARSMGSGSLGHRSSEDGGHRYSLSRGGASDSSGDEGRAEQQQLAERLEAVAVQRRADELAVLRGSRQRRSPRRQRASPLRGDGKAAGRLAAVDAVEPASLRYA